MRLEKYSVRRVSDLKDALAKHTEAPADKCKGYICHAVVDMTEKDKPDIQVVATSVSLQERFAGKTTLGVAMDGGFKFNLLGWPLHILGVLNPRGQLAVCAVALTSSARAEHDVLLPCQAGLPGVHHE